MNILQQELKKGQINKMAKLIGVTPRVLVEEGVEKQFVNTTYVNAMNSIGFNVVMLTLNNPNPTEVFEKCDGFVVTGGSDIDPKWFGETNTGESKEINLDMDILDKLVVEYAAKAKKPMLGICRGIQSINVFMGGTLYQHIGNDHRGILYDHEVHTIKNRLLDFDEKIIVNSYHHQAVKDVAPNMQAIAWHTDGTIEAIIHNELPIIATQWHPEKIPNDEVSKLIFNRFKKLVEEGK